MLKDNRLDISLKNDQDYTDQLKALLDTASGLSGKLDLEKLLTSTINRATQKPLVIPDYQKWSSRSVKYIQTTARCVMVVPLLSAGQLVGTLAAVHLDQDRLFNESDLELLTIVAFFEPNT